jgi:hypothetical protein
MRKSMGVLACAALATIALAGFASPAGAADATGCSGKASSFDADGKPLDTVSAPGKGGTSDHPFEVDAEGRVAWEASPGNSAISKGTWKVETDSTPKLSFSGSGGLEAQKSGTEALRDHLTVDVPLLGRIRVASGTFKAKVVVQGPGGTCTMAGYVKIGGSPLRTPLFYVGAALGVLGLLFLFGSMPTAVAGSASATSAAGASSATPDSAPSPSGETSPTDEVS